MSVALCTAYCTQDRSFTFLSCRLLLFETSCDEELTNTAISFKGAIAIVDFIKGEV